MKKIVIALIMALMSLVAYGQTTKGEIRNGFKDGVFYLNVDENRVLFFKADYENATKNYETGDVVVGKFTTSISLLDDNDIYDRWKGGSDWFIEKMQDEIGNIAMFNFFYEQFKIVLSDDFTVNDNGTASVTMTLLR